MNNSGTYKERIKDRIAYDNDALSDACERMSHSILGRGTMPAIDRSGTGAESAIGEILSYFHIKKTDIPAQLDLLDDMLEYVLQPQGIMRRRVHLDDDWYKTAYGPFLGTVKESGTVVAVLPGKLGGYSYFDESTGRHVRINKKTAELLDSEAYAFYKPFPLRKMRVLDLIFFIKDLITPADIADVLALYSIVTLLGLLTPKFTSLLYGQIVNIGSGKILIAFGGLITMVSLSQLLVSVIQKMVMNRLNMRVSVCINAATMNRIFSLPVDFFRDYSSGELSSIMNYVSSLCNIFVSTIMSTSLSTLFSFLYITQIFNYAPSLVLPSIIIVAVSTVFSMILTLANMKRSEEMMKRSSKTNGLSYSLISGVEKIKLAGAEKRAFAKWAENYSLNTALTYNPPPLIKYGSIISTAITMAGTVVMYFLTVKSGISISEYAAFNVAYGYLSGAFGSLTGIVSQVANIRPTLNMCKPILDAVPEASENKEMLTELNGRVSIEHVSFRYGPQLPYVLEDLTLNIEQGQYVAVVGKTGCGKSTLVRLLLGFETPESGAIFMDNKDIRRVDLKSLRRHIGTVMQNGRTMHGDIFSNIVMSSPRSTLDDAWEAAALAGLDEDIRKMPMGMNTIISEGQGGISGGQKQRLLIARAVVSKPNLLIFDEATSALDNVTQKKISDALDSLKCTRIVIAHRLSTIRNCDRIVVIDGGRIIEDGTYEELMEENGFFRELVAKQQLDEKE